MVKRGHELKVDRHLGWLVVDEVERKGRVVPLFLGDGAPDQGTECFIPLLADLQ